METLQSAYKNHNLFWQTIVLQLLTLCTLLTVTSAAGHFACPFYFTIFQSIYALHGCHSNLSKEITLLSIMHICWLAFCQGHIHVFRDLFLGCTLITSPPFIPPGKLLQHICPFCLIGTTDFQCIAFQNPYFYATSFFTYFPAYLKTYLLS